MSLRQALGLGTAAFLLLFAGALAAEDAAPPGSITFVGQNAVVTANGVFHRWRVTDHRVDFENLAGSFVEVEIDVASIDTEVGRRDDHLRTADFFDVERWPTATARIFDARPSGEDERGRALYSARFELRMRDVTRTVEGRFSVVQTEPLVVEGGLTIDRTQWGIGESKRRFNPMSIGNEIPIAFRASLPAAAAGVAEAMAP